MTSHALDLMDDAIAALFREAFPTLIRQMRAPSRNALLSRVLHPLTVSIFKKICWLRKLLSRWVQVWPSSKLLPLLRLLPYQRRTGH